MNILAIDTSSNVLSLALSAPGGSHSVEIDAGVRHSELLMEWIDRLFISAGLEPGDLDLVACMKGPGSFTGLRIGFATAKGLSLALGIPLAAIPTLDCTAHALSIWPALVLPVLDAKKGCFFAALYRGGSRISDYLDSRPDSLISTLDSYKLSTEENVIITGHGAELFLSRIDASQNKVNFLLDPLFSKGRAQELLQIVQKSCILVEYEGANSDLLYLRKSDAEINLVS